MGKVNEILRKVNASFGAPSTRTPTKNEDKVNSVYFAISNLVEPGAKKTTHNSGISPWGAQPDYSGTCARRGRKEFRSREPQEERHEDTGLRARIKEIKTRTSPAERTLSDFLNLLNELNALNGDGIRLEYSRKFHNVDFFIPNLSLWDLGEAGKREIETFFSERYANRHFGDYSTFLKVWKTSNRYKLHLRFPMGCEEYERATGMLDAKRYNWPKNEERSLAGLMKFIDESNWANKEKKIELFIDSKMNRIVFVASDFVGDKNTRRVDDSINKVVQYLQGKYGAGTERLNWDGEKFWWGVVEYGRVTIGVKAPKIEDYDGTRRKLLVYRDYSPSVRLEEFTDAARIFNGMASGHAMGEDCKERKVAGFLEVLKNKVLYDEKRLMTDDALAALKLEYDNGALTISGKCGSGYALENIVKYFTERYRPRKQDDGYRNFKSKYQYKYDWFEGGVASDKDGEEIPANFLKVGSPFSTSSEEFGQFTLRLSKISVKEHRDAQEWLQKLAEGQ